MRESDCWPSSSGGCFTCVWEKLVSESRPSLGSLDNPILLTRSELQFAHDCCGLSVHTFDAGRKHYSNASSSSGLREACRTAPDNCAGCGALESADREAATTRSTVSSGESGAQPSRSGRSSSDKSHATCRLGFIGRRTSSRPALLARQFVNYGVQRGRQGSTEAARRAKGAKASAADMITKGKQRMRSLSGPRRGRTLMPQTAAKADALSDTASSDSVPCSNSSARSSTSSSGSCDTGGVGSTTSTAIPGSNFRHSCSNIGYEAPMSPRAILVDAVVIKQPEDGSCLFHSIAFGLADDTSAEALRKQIVAFIVAKPSLSIANTTIKEWIAMTSGKTLREYTRELTYRGTWGGALELAIAARIKGVNIHVYERVGNKFRRITAFGEQSASRTVNILYSTEPCRHYDALHIRKSDKQTSLRDVADPCR